MFGMCGSRGGTWGPEPPPSQKSQKYRVSWQYWSGSPEKSQSYQATIQCWAIMGSPAKCHLNGVSLGWPIKVAFCAIWILSLLTKKRCQSWTSSGKTFLVSTCFWCSKELTHPDSFFEYPQHMFWL